MRTHEQLQRDIKGCEETRGDARRHKESRGDTRRCEDLCRDINGLRRNEEIYGDARRHRGISSVNLLFSKILGTKEK